MASFLQAKDNLIFGQILPSFSIGRSPPAYFVQEATEEGLRVFFFFFFSRGVQYLNGNRQTLRQTESTVTVQRSMDSLFLSREISF